MVLKLTEKQQEQLHRNAVQRLQRLLGPRSLAEAMYPKLKTKADEEQAKGRVQGWEHLKKGKAK